MFIGWEGRLVEQSMIKVLGVKDEVLYFWSSLNFNQNPFFILDIIIVTALIYWLYVLIKETRAMRILYGIIILALFFMLGKVLQLAALNYLLKALMTMIIVAIPIVFQPELRSALEKLGRADIVSDFRRLKRSEISDIISEIIVAVKELAKTKTGALIVITQKTGLKDIIETGTKINAKISKELLLTLFQPKSPLHDGAVIIRGNRIAAAGCTLPLSDKRFDSNIGTRHRAAIGLSEQTDAITIVVSEERGRISLATRGILNQDVDEKKLKEILEELIQQGRLIQK